MRTYTPDFTALRPVMVDDLIRMGRDNDGGYVVSARSVDNVDLVIGLGINTDWSFEEAMLERNPTAHLIAVDGSVSNARFLRETLWHGYRAAVGVARGQLAEAKADWRASREWRTVQRSFREFLAAPRRQHIEAMMSDAIGGAMSWADLVRLIPHELTTAAEPRWFVKMDIEGAEFRVLPELLESAAHIRGLVIEFHETNTRGQALDCLIDALKEHFVIVHTHGNNYAQVIPGTDIPLVFELTLVNRNLITPAELARPNTRTYPIAGLDQPCLGDAPDLVLRM